MADTTATMEFSGDGRKAVNEIDKIIASQRAMKQAIVASGKAAKMVTDEARRAMEAYTQSTNRQTVENERLRIKIEEMKRKLEEARDSQRTFGSEAMTMYGKINQILGVAGIGLSLTNIVSLQRQWLDDLKQTARLQDEQSRRVMVQANMSSPEYQRTLREQIIPSASRAAVPSMVAEQIYADIVSAGVNPQQAAGGALSEAMIAGKATGSEDMRAFVQGLASSLLAQNKDFSPENVRAEAVPFKEIFDKTKVQASDMQDMAKAMGFLTQIGMAPDEVRAAFAVQKNVMAGPEAETSIRRIFGAMRTASSIPSKNAMLEVLGGADQIDMVGESPAQALQNLRDMMDRLPEEQKAGMLTKLFGEKQVAGATYMLNNIDTFVRNQDLQRVSENYDKAAREATAGDNAAAVRRENEKRLLDLRDFDRKRDVVGRAAEIQLEQQRRGDAPFIRDLWKYFADNAIAMGLDPTVVSQWPPGSVLRDQTDWKAQRRAEARARGINIPPGQVELPPVQRPVSRRLPGVRLDWENLDLQGDPAARAIMADRGAVQQAEAEVGAARLAYDRKRRELELDGRLSYSDKEELKPLKETLDRLDETLRAMRIDQKKQQSQQNLNRQANL